MADQRIIDFTRSVLDREARAMNLPRDTSDVKVFKVVRADVDGDGEDETCFAAGLPQFFSQGVCGLLDGSRFVELVPYQEGFRDLLVTDIDGDGRPEIVTWAQVGSGAFLKLGIFKYDGSVATSLFPDVTFHQGLLETKDLDLDGVDELVIWEGRWEKGAHWEPQPFTIHVYHAGPEGYWLAFEERLDTRYQPASIVSRPIGMFGVPTVIEHRYSAVEERRREFESLRAAGQVTEQYVAELVGDQALLRDEGFLEESLSLLDIAVEASQSLPRTSSFRRFSFLLWRDRAMTASLLGDYPTAAHACAQAIAGADEEALADLPAYFLASLYRELGGVQAYLGDYERALAAQATAFTLLERLDITDPGNRVELSRLYSNSGLVRAWIGDEQTAIEHFGKAIELDTELGRPAGRSINQTGIANVHRHAGRTGEAVTWYEAALHSLAEVSDRDRESDANLELGLALTETGQPDQGLERVRRALLLTSVGNLRQQDWKHYLYLGEAHRALHQHAQAEAAFRLAESATSRSVTSEIRWQAKYGLGLVLRASGRGQEAKAALEQAVGAVEQFRRQYLPETLKISMLADKSDPYEPLVDLLASQDGTTAFGYMEQAKSRVFLERLATSPVRWPESAPAELAQRESWLIDELRTLTLHESAARGEPSLPEELDRVEERLGAVWTRIEASGPEGAEYVSLRRGLPLGYGGVLDLLADPGPGG